MTGLTGPGGKQGGSEPDRPATPAGDPDPPSWLARSEGREESTGPVALLEQALTECRDRGDVSGEAGLLAKLAVARYAAGDAVGAGGTATECERVALLADAVGARPWGTLVQAMLAYDRGELEDALGCARSALEQFRESGDSTHVWRATMTCMLVSKTLGHLMDARDSCMETIQLVECRGDEEVATVLPELAALVLALGYTTEAIVVYSAGLTAAEHLGIRYPPSSLDRYRARIATARSRLPEAEFEAARLQGESLPLADALDLVGRCVESGRSRTSLPAD